jgi:sulfur carrier protein ThiS
MVKVYNEKEARNFDIEAETVAEIVKKLDLNLNEFIVTVNGELCVGATKVKNSDDIKFLSVVSGG